MTDLINLTIAQAIKGMKNKDFNATELTKAYIENIEKNKKINAYVTDCSQVALESAKISDEKYLKGTARSLEGIPLGIKDLFCTKGIKTTACSQILENFIPQYESTVTDNLLNSGALFLGKLNMDEFAM